MKNVLFLILSLTILASCASRKKEEKIVEAKASQTNVHDSKGLGAKIHELIATSENLSEAQKTQLTALLDSNKKRAEELTEKSYAFRAVLVQELLSGKVNRKRVSILKKDIREVEAAKLKNTFDTVEKISDIVSDQPNKDKFAEQLMIFDRHIR